MFNKCTNFIRFQVKQSTFQSFKPEYGIKFGGLLTCSIAVRKKCKRCKNLKAIYILLGLGQQHCEMECEYNYSDSI